MTGQSILGGGHTMNATGKPRKRDHDRTGRFAATFAWMRGRVSYAGIIAERRALRRARRHGSRRHGDPARQRRLAADPRGRRPRAGDRQGCGALARDRQGCGALAGDRQGRGPLAGDRRRTRSAAPRFATAASCLADISTGARNALHGAQGPAGPGPAGVAEAARCGRTARPPYRPCSDQRSEQLPEPRRAGRWTPATGSSRPSSTSSNLATSTRATRSTTAASPRAPMCSTRADFQLEAFGSHRRHRQTSR